MTTDAMGRFAALLPRPGTYEVSARHLAYTPLTWGPIEATEAEGVIELFIELQPHVARLEAVEVEVKGDFHDSLEGRARALARYFDQRMLELNGFRGRERRAFGTHLGPEDLEYRRFSLRTLLRGIPGVNVTRDDRGVRMRAGGSFLLGGATCRPEIYLDGLSFLNTEFRDVVVLENILAVEVYTRAIQLPVEYRGRVSGNCGAILVWTRR